MKNCSTYLPHHGLESCKSQFHCQELSGFTKTETLLKWQPQDMNMNWPSALIEGELLLRTLKWKNILVSWHGVHFSFYNRKHHHDGTRTCVTHTCKNMVTKDIAPIAANMREKNRDFCWTTFKSGSANTWNSEKEEKKNPLKFPF